MDLYNRIEQLNEKLAKVVHDVRDYDAKIETEKRSKTAEDLQTIERMNVEAEQLMAEIETANADLRTQQTLEKSERHLTSSAGRKTAPAQPYVSNANQDDIDNIEFRNALAGRKHREYRSTGSPLAQSTAGTSKYLSAPLQWNNTLIKAIDNNVYMDQYCTHFDLNGSDTLTFPKEVTAMSRPTRTDEVTQPTEDTVADFAQVSFVPQEMSKLVKVTWKQLENSSFPTEQYLFNRYQYLFAEAKVYDRLNGRGPTTYLESVGVFDAAATGHIATTRDVSTGSTTDITADVIRDVRYAKMSPLYAPGARWCFGQNGFAKIMKLKDGKSGYMWQPSMVPGAPSLLEGLPVDICAHCPDTWTTGLYVGALINWSCYWIVTSKQLQIRVLDQTYANTKQTGFMGILYDIGAPMDDQGFVRLKTA